ncbi:MAG TPA: OmpA family protein [Acetobacteraceae bacterium]|nr:OmpA family protein [Acetobacteraceae bacterium]
MKLRSALLAATVLAVPFAAKAQPVTGLYVGAGVGVNLMQDESADLTTTGGTFGAGRTGSGKFGTQVGPAAVVSVGWGFGNGLRAEIEGNWRYNNLSGSNIPGVGVGGDEQKFGGMVNVLYDFVGLTSMVQPYVGLGAGYVGVQEQGFNLSAGGATAHFPTTTKGGFAYQAILGVAVPLDPKLALTAEYRFMGVAGHRSYSALGTGGTTFSGNLNNNFNHAFLIGVRYNFGQPEAAPVAPAPAAVPAAAAARSYLVFFDWDKATLTDRARQIISEAASNSTKVQYTRIEVNGYTDTSGTPRYNQGLSVRRAQAVAAELVKDGVPKTAISIQGFGETHLLVPTGPGVREPQNRRVEIIIK